MPLKIKEFFTSKPIVNIFFFIFVFLSAICFILAFYIFEERFNVFFLGNINADVRINVETPFQNIDKTIVYINGEPLRTGISKIKNTYLTYEYNNYPVYNIKLKAENIDEIKDVVITVGDKLHYYTNSDIKNFKKDDNGSYIFPKKELTLYKTSKYMNHRGALTEFAVKFLAVFYNPNYYIVPLFFTFLAFLIWFLNKDKINISFNLFKNSAIWWILFVAILTRLAGNDYAFWSDEIYTATIAGNPNLPFWAVFSDPGNPPLFFIFARFWQMLVGLNESLLRILPTVFSIASIYALYRFILYILKDKKIALLAAFILSINCCSLSSAKEFRCYSLCALLSVIAAYLLFKIIRENKTKDYILYTITAVLMANAYYFEILVLISNFIYFLFQPVTKQAKIKLFIGNIIAAISFLPYFLYTSLNKAVLNNGFNPMPERDIPFMVQTFIKYYSTPAIAFCVIVLFFITAVPFLRKKFFDDTKKEMISLYFYTVYTALFLFTVSYLMSLVRPMIREYYYIIIITLMVIPVALFFFMPFKKKVLSIICAGVLLISPFFGTKLFEKEITILLNFQPMFEYLEADSVQFRKQGLKIGAGLHDYLRYADFYKRNLAGDEVFFLYEFPWSATIDKAALASGADVVYTRVNFKSYNFAMEKFSQYFDVSSIRTNKDVIVARLVRKKKK